jgi:hypothetical protein
MLPTEKHENKNATGYKNSHFIVGRELEPGETVNEGDVYESDSGKWKSANLFAGFQVPTSGCKIVRPQYLL